MQLKTQKKPSSILFQGLSATGSGVDEVRLMEPMPFGKSGRISRDELFTDDERKKLIELHMLCNKDANLPKVSVCSYFESREMFGCGAAGYYSFIDIHGDLYPCD